MRIYINLYIYFYVYTSILESVSLEFLSLYCLLESERVLRFVEGKKLIVGEKNGTEQDAPASLLNLSIVAHVKSRDS